MQLTYLMSDGVTAAPTLQTSKLEFYITNPIKLFKFLDFSLCKVWALLFVFFGTEVQVSRNKEQRKDPKNTHAYTLALLFQHCDSA